MRRYREGEHAGGWTWGGGVHLIHRKKRIIIAVFAFCGVSFGWKGKFMTGRNPQSYAMPIRMDFHFRCGFPFQCDYLIRI